MINNLKGKIKSEWKVSKKDFKPRFKLIVKTIADKK